MIFFFAEEHIEGGVSRGVQFDIVRTIVGCWTCQLIDIDGGPVVGILLQLINTQLKKKRFMNIA